MTTIVIYDKVETKKCEDGDTKVECALHRELSVWWKDSVDGLVLSPQSSPLKMLLQVGWNGTPVIEARIVGCVKWWKYSLSQKEWYRGVVNTLRLFAVRDEAY